MVQTIIDTAKFHRGYNNLEKESFHRHARTYLNRVAKALGLAKGTYTVRSNKAGIACLGEVTLHADTFYLQLGGSMANAQFYYRTCKGQKDYTGGVNRWMDYDRLTDFGYIVKTLKELCF